MTTRTVSLSDDAYQRLKRLKRERESFSDLVLRLTGGEDLMRFAGTISPELAAELDAHSRSFRDHFDQAARQRSEGRPPPTS